MSDFAFFEPDALSPKIPGEPNRSKKFCSSIDDRLQFAHVERHLNELGQIRSITTRSDKVDTVFYAFTPKFAVRDCLGSVKPTTQRIVSCQQINRLLCSRSAPESLPRHPI